MNYSIQLKDLYKVQGGVLKVYLSDCPFDRPQPWCRPALIVVPGGGYHMVSKREGAPVANAFVARGFNTFVLEYTTQPDGVRYPEQLLELASAVDYVKKNARDLHINPDEVFVVGFSAGGHLTANLSVAWKADILRGLDCKPTAVGLGYPVISSKLKHVGSYHNLLDGYSDEEKQRLLLNLNLDEMVSADTVPAFIWTTSCDTVVPVANSLAFAQALAAHDIKFELHIYPEIDHGASTCDPEINAPHPALAKNAQWLDNCASFFRLFTAEKY